LTQLDGIVHEFESSNEENIVSTVDELVKKIFQKKKKEQIIETE